MSNQSSKLLDDFAKLMTDAAEAAKGMRGEVETTARTQIEMLLNRLSIVRRDEFEVVKEMAVKAQSQVQVLTARLEKLEKRHKE